MKKILKYLLIAFVGFIGIGVIGNLIDDSGSAEPERSIKKNLSYSIISEKPQGKIKNNIHVQIESAISEDEIRAIANEIKARNSNYNNIYIFYLLPHMRIGNGAWATSHFTPTLKIDIKGASNEEISILKGINSDNVVIGKWLYNDPPIERSLIIEEKDGNYQLKSLFKDGSTGLTELNMRIKGTDKIFMYENNFGEYYKLGADGILGLYDNEGLIFNLSIIE